MPQSMALTTKSQQFSMTPHNNFNFNISRIEQQSPVFISNIHSPVMRRKKTNELTDDLKSMVDA